MQAWICTCASINETWHAHTNRHATTHCTQMHFCGSTNTCHHTRTHPPSSCHACPPTHAINHTSMHVHAKQVCTWLNTYNVTACMHHENLWVKSNAMLVMYYWMNEKFLALLKILKSLFRAWQEGKFSTLFYLVIFTSIFIYK